MKNFPHYFLHLLAYLFLTTGALASSRAGLAADFANPPDAAKPWVWWHWMNGNVSREGITKDLEAIKGAGFGGVILFEESDRIPPGPVRYLSPEHLALLAHAGRECTRVGLQFGFQNCPGWSSSGGPWVTPEFAMKHVTWSEQVVNSSQRLKIRLARPSTVVRPFTNLGPPKRYGSHDYYRDVAVLAFPTPREPNWRLENWQQKMGYLTGYQLRDSTVPAPEGSILDSRSIVDLTDKLRADGSLDWQPPAGSWTIMRFGYTLTEHQNREAPTTGATGLEIDKLSAAATDFHWQQFVTKVIDATGGADSPVTTVLMDSYEPLTQTWTPNMPEDFRRLRSYDLAPYLLCLTGRVVGSVRESEKFLRDYRRTLADLIAENYYGRFESNCRARGLTFAAEGYGYYGSFFDDFQMASRADLPMGEFWAGVIKWHHWAGKVAASAADINGRHVVGVEAFTSGNDMAAWKWHPYTLKAQGDYFFCRGLNRIYIQASAHQPWGDQIKPGMTMGPNGIQMNRNNTWFAQSRAWVAYLARCQYLLQQGQLVTDVFYDYGDNAPSSFRPNKAITSKGPKGVPWGPDVDVSPDIWTPLPVGRDFHVGNSSVLEHMSVNDRGEIVLPGGQVYQVLLLPDDDRIEYATLKKVEELVRTGATLLGPRPARTASLNAPLDADDRIQALAQKLWGNIDGTSVTSFRHGRGMVYFGVTLEEVLERRGLPRDFEYSATTGHVGEAPKLDYIHRRLDGMEFYFVSNLRNAPASVECMFRAEGRPELWQPQTGVIAPAYVTRSLKDGRVAVTLNLEPAESCFVVFHAAAKRETGFTSFLKDGQPVASAATARLQEAGGQPVAVAFVPGTYVARHAEGQPLSAAVKKLPPPIELSNDWEVSFPAGSGAPANLALPRLLSYHKHEDGGVRHFSGTATYRKTFHILPSVLESKDAVAELDLGDVQVIAELSVNGRDFGILWKPPFRRDITSALRRGENTLVVKVTNLWRNRLIGDAKISHFTSKDQARLMDQMLAGHTKLSFQGESQGPGASDEFYPLPAWVWSGQPNPDPRLHTFTVFPFLTSETPLVPSGLLGPVRIHWGKTVELK